MNFPLQPMADPQTDFSHDCFHDKPLEPAVTDAKEQGSLWDTEDGPGPAGHDGGYCIYFLMVFEAFKLALLPAPCPARDAKNRAGVCLQS